MNRPYKKRRGGRPKHRAPRGGGPHKPETRVNDAARLRLKRLDGNRFAFLPPICALDRKEDLDEVHAMIAAGEIDIARDELLYLVGDCRGFLDAHNLLAELALEEEDIALARGHYGFAYEIGLDSLPPGFKGRLPANTDYNRAFYLAGRGLARCLIAQGKPTEGRDVLELLARFDPDDKDVRSLLEELQEGQKSN